ncbi:MAG TPA: exodeoxyribonuclease VII large subunit [Geminicoccaceae bacterium]|nr:exodeoxyribonuclease VII large subunit [Geminicoccus sp.]HMU49351.1 exodeoxyribonuclease VII large subunit [Geminicoccaceae bacterium]
MNVDNLREYSVSEIAFALKRTIEDAYGHVRVRGEISGFKRAASGHSYFALKDDRAVLDAVSWKGNARRLSFAPEDGLEVVCTGQLTTYPGRSRYQLVVEHMEPAGVGALMALLEERKRRLAAEGLFDADRKRPLPFLPAVVGVVTSPTGAVIRDILHRLADRFPTRVVLWPVAVQGDGAAQQVAAAIDGFCTLPELGDPPRPDLLIVARGGGSIEDLWAFNEEVVARAAARCTVPLISAVGHETDTTLIDLVADRRAPTPTAAAEMAVPVRRDLALQLDGLGQRAGQAVAKQLAGLVQHVSGLARGLPEPRIAVAHATQRADDLGERLGNALSNQLRERRGRLDRAFLALRPPAQLVREHGLRLDHRLQRLRDLSCDRLSGATRALVAAATRLEGAPLPLRLREAGQRLEAASGRLSVAAARRIADAEAAAARLGQLVDSLGPMRVLARGYAIVRAQASGRVLPSRAEAAEHQAMELQFADGRLPVLRAEPGRRARQRQDAPPPPAQESLL